MADSTNSSGAIRWQWAVLVGVLGLLGWMVYRGSGAKTAASNGSTGASSSSSPLSTPQPTLFPSRKPPPTRDERSTKRSSAPGNPAARPTSAPPNPKGATPASPAPGAPSAAPLSSGERRNALLKLIADTDRVIAHFEAEEAKAYRESKEAEGRAARVKIERLKVLQIRRRATVQGLPAPSASAN